jgi:pyruvate dehydrogenase E2 component (dihydrolipoamide acetyltransferase)
MAKILEMPKLSPTMEEGVLAMWHKKEGDPIEVDDLLAEVETDKATMEFRSFDKGTLLKLLVDAGATIQLGQPVAIVGNPGEDVSGLVKNGATNGAATHAAPAPAPEKPKETSPEKLVEKPAEVRATTTPLSTDKGSPLDRTERERPELMETSGGRVLASPYVRKTARDRGIDLNGVHGSGPNGRVLPEDLSQVALVASGASPQGGAAVQVARLHSLQSGGEAFPAPRKVPLSPMRKTIAKRLVESKRNVPHFYLTIDVDAERLGALRERVNVELARDGGASSGTATKISVNDLLIKAVAIALQRVPSCNAQFSEEGLLYFDRVDISVAVAVDEGLVTPVVRNAQDKSVAAIAREVRELASRARSKKLKPEEMTNGTFSISNLGMFGIDEFSAVINPPEGAILAVGRVREEPVVRDGQVVPGKRLAMTLSCDHRVIDGAVGAAFLAELRHVIEQPMQVLLG